MNRYAVSTVHTDICISFPGSAGCIGLAVSFDCLGGDGWLWAGILTGFLMILQNLLAVFLRQLYAGSMQTERNLRKNLWEVAENRMSDQVNVDELEIP